MNDAEFQALLRTDLSVFTERCFNHLFRSTEYLPNWHIELIASALTDVLEGRTKRLIINVPPRSLKSVIVSVAFVAWALGRDPNKQIICASYGQHLADKLALDCRSVMMSAWFRRLFGVQLQGSRPSVSDFRTLQGGGRFATSVGGVLTGRGGDIILIDDPLKPDGAISDAERNAANDWFDNTVTSRLNDKQTGAMVIIMQRLHLDDLVAHVQEKELWKVIELPAIAQEEQRFRFSNVFGEHHITRQAGDVLHSAREPIEVLNKLRQSIGEYNFAGQYQQSPAPLGGGIFKAQWIQTFEAHQRPSQFEQIVQSWDTASKETESADYSVCTTWGVKDADRYLIDVLRAKMEFPQLYASVIAQIKNYQPQVVLIEDKASGIQLIQELRDKGHSMVKAYKPVGDKFMRAMAQTPAFEGGFVKLPANAPWLDAYVLELITFPRAKHNDQVDSTSQALGWLAMHGREPGLLTYMRELYEVKMAGG